MKNGFWLFALLLICRAVHAGPGEVTYVYTDPQGTVLMETDAQGNITATFDYTPYEVQALGAPPNGLGYTGHVNDPDTGLVYMQARYYDPLTGRFLSVDPVTSTAGNTFNFNRYGYANNNPVINMDPDGRETGQAYAAIYRMDGGVPQHYISPNDKVGPAIEAAFSILPVIGDGVNIANAIENPSALNISAAAVGVIPVVGGPAAKAIKGGGEAISMTKAVEKGVEHVGSDAKVIMTKGGNAQFTNTTKDAAGNTITKNARFDVNPANKHGQSDGPHLNIETHENGVTTLNDHVPIDSTTIRRGDHD